MTRFSIHSDSTLTNRYQTTIPEIVRKALHLEKRDKIRYTLLDDGKIVISRVDEDDPVLTQFLTFLAEDISQHPESVVTLSPDLIERIQPLVSEVDIDLNSPLPDEDNEA